MTGTLHFICGRLASGKTTLARKLINDQRAVFFCEDVWLSKLSDGIQSLEDYVRWSRRCRSVMGPLIIEVLRSGSSVVMDFAGNRAVDRMWIRSLLEEAGAPHILHYLPASEEVCLARLRSRNVDKPEGLFFAETSDEDFYLISKFFEPPAVEEGFNVVLHEVRPSFLV